MTDALLPLGASRDARHVYAFRDAKVSVEGLPGVTGIIRTVDKSGPLVGWAKRETARCAVDNLDTVRTIKETGGRQAAIDYLKGIPDFQRDTAADLGSAVHAFAEQIARGESIMVTEAEAPYVEAYRRFLADWQPKFLAAEEIVISLRHRYGGTLDAIAVMDGETWLLDLKTSSGVYAETALQLAAYRYADFFARTGTDKRYRIPRIDRCGVVHVRPEGARLVDYTDAVTPKTYQTFLAARQVWTWQQVTKDGVGKEIKREVAA
jgi:hypothetical protein